MSRWRIGIICVLSAFFLAVPWRSLRWALRDRLQGNAERVVWTDSLNTAWEQAKREKKSLFVEFSASWCGPCQIMKNETFHDPAVARLLNERFVAVEIDTDHQPKVAAQFAVAGIPDIVILDPDGTILLRTVGYRDSGALQTQLESALSRSHPDRPAPPGWTPASIQVNPLDTLAPLLP